MFLVVVEAIYSTEGLLPGPGPDYDVLGSETSKAG
jgi:hypothetical protein